MSKYLTVYSGIVTVAFILSAGLHFVRREAAVPSRFGEITVERLNLVEKDGTLRLVLSNTSRFPGSFVRGKETPRPDRRTSGFLFLNEEGTENGGLIFDGRGSDGGVQSNGSLTFDAYEQDQVVQIFGSQEGAATKAGLIVSDRPRRSIQIDFDEERELAKMDASAREELMRQREQSGYYGRLRVFAGSEGAQSLLGLADPEGRTRLLLRVAADGAAALEFLDTSGKTVRRIGPERTD